VLPRLEGRPDGLVPTSLPGLRFYRATSRSGGRKAVEARMVTFALILQGRKRVDFGDRVLTYAPGSYLFVTGERRYGSRIVEASTEEPYASITLELPPEQLTEGLVSLRDAGESFDAGVDDPPALVADLSGPIVGALERLLATLDDPVARSAFGPLHQRELVLHLLRGPAGATLRRAAATDDERIRTAMAWLRDHARERLRVDEVARRVAMSPSHFAHRFRQVARMGPMQYVKHHRLLEARLLMLADGLGAAEAAVQVGYASTSHFNRDFKRHFGAPPGAYVTLLRDETGAGARLGPLRGRCRYSSGSRSSATPCSARPGTGPSGRSARDEGSRGTRPG